MNIALIGYGKMGKTIEPIAKVRGHEIVLIIEKNNLSELNRINLKKVDVAIDFSTPNSARTNIMKAIDSGIPVISGTTGWLDHYSEVIAYCDKKKGSFLYASNFSLGVNLFFELNKKMTKIMKQYEQYEVDIHEIHHKEKKDSPSGTAISLAEQIIAENKSFTGWISNEISIENSIKIVSERKEKITGIHQVNYNSQMDSISIKHKTHSRKAFALGAVIAAEWIRNKNGCYSMYDVLFSKNINY
jgi:4-hydroxy-tetrahydrodipicolinate reductase